VEIDAAVIGGGVVGLACAAEIARGGKSVVVLERHRRVAQETSARSSEVIHAGLYYARGSLKALDCVRGANLLYAWCAARGVPHARCGKLVVAAREEEIESLESLAARAKENGANVAMISRERARDLEPEVVCVSALESPNTGIVDSHAFAASLAHEIASREGHVALGRRVVALDARSDGVTIACDGVLGREDVRASFAVNAAGLYADEIAAMTGFDHPQRFVKGSYFRCRRALVKRLVYPLPSRDGLGVHATIDLAGAVRFGPDTEPARSRDDYDVDESRRAEFFAAARRYVPALREEDLAPDTAGIRPKVPSGDFVIERRARVVHLLGIESPGLTAALAIAERVAKMIA